MAQLTIDNTGNIVPSDITVRNTSGMFLENIPSVPSGNFSALNQPSNYSAMRQAMTANNAYGGYTTPIQPVNFVDRQAKSRLANQQAVAPATTGAKTPPNWRDNLLNYVLSPKGQGMAQGLLEASGYSEVPVTFGQALAMGLKRGNEAEATAAASQLAKDKFEYQKSQDLITNLLEQQKIKPQETFTQQMIEVPDGKGGTTTVPVNVSDLTGKVTPVMSGGGQNITIGNKDTSDGFKEVNTTYAKEFTNWNLTGGFAVAKENIGKINDVLKVLDTDIICASFCKMLRPKTLDKS